MLQQRVGGTVGERRSDAKAVGRRVHIGFTTRATVPDGVSPCTADAKLLVSCCLPVIFDFLKLRLIPKAPPVPTMGGDPRGEAEIPTV